jgi:two-component system NtrC family sensor kinase
MNRPEDQQNQSDLARRIVDSFPDAIVALDREGRHTYASPRLREALGVEPQALEAQTFGRRLLPYDLSAARALFDDLVAGRRDFGMIELRGCHTDGALRVTSISAAPLRDSSGKITGVVASLRDVTAWKTQEQEAQQEERRAALARMVSGVAHELNNPLTVILGACEMAASAPGRDEVRERLALIQQHARRGAAMVEDLTAFCEPPAPEANRLDLGETVERALRLYRHSLRKNRIAVDLLPQPGLPQVRADRRQVMQALLSLVMNAEQAMVDARSQGALHIRLGAAEGRVWVAIKDDGPGIPSEALPYLFDPFFTTKPVGKGRGLGLSASLSLIRQQGGTLTVENAPEGGALATMTLPAAPDAVTAPPEPPRTSSLQGRSLLVVDDEPAILALIRAALAPRGIQVDCAASGEQAVRLAEQRCYDCVLCDWKMPGMSGGHVFERLPAPAPDCPRRFIIMSGDLMQPEAQAFLGRSRVTVLRKPFTVAELAAIVGQELARAA